MSDAINQILMGAAGDGAGGLLTTMILAVGARIARRFQTESVIQPLRQALEASLIAAFDSLPDKTDSLNNYYMQCMADFLRQRVVVQELSVLLSPDENFDMDMLRKQFIVVSQGYSPDKIPGLDFEGFIKTFSRSFYEAVKRSPELQGIIVIERLDQLVLLIENSTELSERSVIAAELAADSSTKILTLLSNHLSRREPALSVGFLDDNDSVVNHLLIQLRKIPDRPNYDQLISSKRKELLDRRGKKDSLGITKMFAESSKYPQRVEKYLEEYREYLEQSYYYALFKDRVRQLTPVVANNGKATAHKIIIRLKFPREIEPVDEDNEENHVFYELYNNTQASPTCPSEPDLFEGLLSSSSFSYLTEFQPYQLANVSSVFRNFGGPYFGQSSDNLFVTYEIDEVVQRREEKLEPFLITLRDIKESSIWEIQVTIDAEEFETELTHSLTLKLVIKDE